MSVFTPANTLSIPNAMAPVTAAITAAAAVFIPLLFVLEIMTEQKRMIEGETPEFAKVLFNTFAVIFAFSFLYKWIFLKIIASCEFIGLSVTNSADWAAWTQKIFEQAPTKISWTDLNVITFLSAIFSVILEVIETVFMTVRYVLLCLLYCIGPIAFVAGISRMSRSFLKSWFVSLFQISFWVIMLKVMQETLIQLNQSSLLFAEDPITTAVIQGIIVTATVMMIPAITSMVLSGSNLSLAGSVAAAALGAVVMKAGGRSAVEKAKSSFNNVGNYAVGKTMAAGSYAAKKTGVSYALGKSVSTGKDAVNKTINSVESGVKWALSRKKKSDLTGSKDKDNDKKDDPPKVR